MSTALSNVAYVYGGASSNGYINLPNQAQAIPMMVHAMDYDGIPRRHSEQIYRYVNGKTPPYGYCVNIPDSDGYECTYSYQPGQSNSGWVLKSRYNRTIGLAQMQTAVTTVGTAISPSAKLKEPAKNSKTVRHQFLRNRLKTRIKKD